MARVLMRKLCRQYAIHVPPIFVRTVRADYRTGLPTAVFVGAPSSLLRTAQCEQNIARCDLNGIVTSWNRAAEWMFGFPAEEMIGQHLLPPAR